MLAPYLALPAPKTSALASASVRHHQVTQSGCTCAGSAALDRPGWSAEARVQQGACNIRVGIGNVETVTLEPSMQSLKSPCHCEGEARAGLLLKGQGAR